MSSLSEARAYLEKVIEFDLEFWFEDVDLRVHCYYKGMPPEQGVSSQCSDNTVAAYILTEVRWYGGIHYQEEARRLNRTYDAHYPFCTVHCAEMRQYFEGTPSDRIATYRVQSL